MSPQRKWSFIFSKPWRRYYNRSRKNPNWSPSHGKCDHTDLRSTRNDLFSSCVDDGYCSLEQADLIQKYLEKKLRKLYHIEQTMGKSVLSNDEDEEEEEVRNVETKEPNPVPMSDDELSRSPAKGITVTRPVLSDTETPVNLETTKDQPSTSDNPTAVLSPPVNEDHPSKTSPSVSSPTKADRSPGEITKAISPSSLSEASPKPD